MAKVAHDTGSGAMLFPKGITNFEEIPADLMTALRHATLIIGWQANLESHEMPPQWMWPFFDELEVWFEEVTAARKAKYSSGNDDEGSGLQGNALAKDGIRQSV